MRRSNGTGLHRYWYIRLITLLLTVVLPFGAAFYIFEYKPDLINYSNMVPIIFGWLVYVIILTVVSLKIEDILEKKRNPKRQRVVINNVELSEADKEAFNIAMSQLGNIINKQSNTETSGNNSQCPKCYGLNTVKMNTGKTVCMDCEHKF